MHQAGYNLVPRPPQLVGGGGREDRPVTVELGVVSDVICRWCHVGERRLEPTLPLLGPPG